MKNQTLCKFPWSGITSTMVNTFRPCCRFPLNEESQYPTTNDILTNGNHALNNNFLCQLRQDMLEGIPRKECNKCYVEEQSGIQSMRQKANENFTSLAIDTNFEKLEFLEISLDNLCNLECRMCNSRFSTKLLNRDEKLYSAGFVEFQPNKVQYKTLQIMDALDLTDLKMIKMLGGEPLISPHLSSFLDKVPYPDKVELLIITNATTLPSQEIIEKFKKFKSIRFDFSIDGIDNYNDYQRVGSNFNKIISNVQFFIDNVPGEHSIHSVYSSLNIFGLNSSTEWFSNNFNLRTSIDIVANNILSPYFAPNWYVDKIIDSISIHNPYYEYIRNLFNNNHNYQSNKWIEFLEYTAFTDQLYNTDIFKINPILADQIQQHMSTKLSK